MRHGTIQHCACSEQNAQSTPILNLELQNLVLQINFDASPCWYRDGFAPADVKAHLMTFFMEYLCHFKIIKAGSVPDEELPPLGFYPAAREEKDIDRDGHVVERDPDYSPAPDFSSW